MNKEGINSLVLTIDLSDPIISRYVEKYPESERIGKLQEAMIVGITALQSAIPHIDTSLVESRFTDFSKKIESSFDKLQRDMEGKIKSTFEGEQSTLNSTLGKYYDPTNGKLQKLIQDQIGVGSQFYKKLDPSNSESIITSILTSLERIIQMNNGEILKEFSLDAEGSSLHKLQFLLAKQFEEFFQKSVMTLSDIKTAIGVKNEASRGTQKGKEFEDIINDYLIKTSETSNYDIEYIGNKNGKFGRVGDFLLTFNQSSSIPGYRIVIEAKNSDSYNLDKAIKELGQAKENREADIGIFIFKKNKEPIAINDFYRSGSDYYITLDDDSVSLGEKPIYLDSAIKISQLSALALRNEKSNSDIDTKSIERNLTEINDQVKLLSQIKSKSSTIENNGKWIREIASDMETKLTETISKIHSTIFIGEKL